MFSEDISKQSILTTLQRISPKIWRKKTANTWHTQSTDLTTLETTLEPTNA